MEEYLPVEGAAAQPRAPPPSRGLAAAQPERLAAAQWRASRRPAEGAAAQPERVLLPLAHAGGAGLVVGRQAASGVDVLDDQSRAERAPASRAALGSRCDAADG